MVANLDRTNRCAASAADTIAPSKADKSQTSSVTRNFRAKLKNAVGPLLALTAMTWRGRCVRWSSGVVAGVVDVSTVWSRFDDAIGGSFWSCVLAVAGAVDRVARERTSVWACDNAAVDWGCVIPGNVSVDSTLCCTFFRLDPPTFCSVDMLVWINRDFKFVCMITCFYRSLDRFLLLWFVGASSKTENKSVRHAFPRQRKWLNFRHTRVRHQTKFSSCIPLNNTQRTISTRFEQRENSTSVIVVVFSKDFFKLRENVNWCLGRKLKDRTATTLRIKYPGFKIPERITNQ